jgi:hypothetical protein
LSAAAELPTFVAEFVGEAVGLPLRVL